MPNLFVMGATAFPQNPGYNPTDTVGALAYWAADAIVNQLPEESGPARADLIASTPRYRHEMRKLTILALRPA